MTDHAQEARKALIKECAEIAAKAIFSHPKVEGYRDVIRDPSKGELVRAVRGALDELAASQLPEGDRQWVSPIKTVADLVNNLLTIDQGMEVHGAYFLPEGVPDRCRTRGLSLSREHVANGRIQRGDAIPYSLVIWTAQEKASQHPSTDRGSAA